MTAVGYVDVFTEVVWFNQQMWLFPCFSQPVSMSTQNVGFLNVGRVQSGLFQPPFSEIPCLLKPALYLRPRKPTIMLKLARIKLEST